MCLLILTKCYVHQLCKTNNTGSSVWPEEQIVCWRTKKQDVPFLSWRHCVYCLALQVPLKIHLTPSFCASSELVFRNKLQRIVRYWICLLSESVCYPNLSSPSPKCISHAKLWKSSLWSERKAKLLFMSKIHCFPQNNDPSTLSVLKRLTDQI